MVYNRISPLISKVKGFETTHESVCRAVFFYQTKLIDLFMHVYLFNNKITKFPRCISKVKGFQTTHESVCRVAFFHQMKSATALQRLQAQVHTFIFFSARIHLWIHTIRWSLPLLYKGYRHRYIYTYVFIFMRIYTYVFTIMYIDIFIYLYTLSKFRFT